MHFVLQFPMFGGMPISMVQRLALVLDKVVFKKDHLVYKQQDETHSMYFIWEGTVQVENKKNSV